MVSFRMALPPKETNFFGSENSSNKKRKFAELEKESKHVELQLEKPLPLEWQQCLDLQSGQIHFYNTRTRKRTCMDPREEQEPGFPKMSLELELNLPYDSASDDTQSHNLPDERGPDRSAAMDGVVQKKLPSDLCKIIKSVYGPSEPWWRPPAIFSDLGQEQPEMVAALCMRCHMLVMLCKASPTCPNCKFVHPVDCKGHGLPFKPSFGVLCCED